MKSLSQEIKKQKTKLIKKAKENGLYENFGQNEINMLVDNYIELYNYSIDMNQKRRLIESFNEWCMTYTG